MDSSRYLERRATLIATLNRDQLTRRIKHFRGPFRLDFSDDYLEATSLDRLRHILLAALIVGKSSRH